MDKQPVTSTVITAPINNNLSRAVIYGRSKPTVDITLRLLTKTTQELKQQPADIFPHTDPDQKSNKKLSLAQLTTTDNNSIGSKYYGGDDERDYATRD